MGILICKTHGATGFVETCSHVASELDRKNVPNCHRVSFLTDLFLCDDCFTSYEFERFASIDLVEIMDLSGGRMEGDHEEALVAFLDAGEKAYGAAYDAIDRRLFCVKCLRELEAESPTGALGSGDGNRERH